MFHGGKTVVCVCVCVSGVGAMTWSPLACGIISGKYDSGVPAYSRASLKVLRLPSVSLSLHVFISRLLQNLWLCIVVLCVVGVLIDVFVSSRF